MMRDGFKETTTLAREIGEKLRNIRKNLGLTQKQVAERMVERIDYTYIGKIERGELMPSLKMLKRIGEGLEIPVDFFFQKETVVELLNLLPRDIRDIAQDDNKIAFFKGVKELDEEDVPLVAEIIRILNKHRKLRKEKEEQRYLPSAERVASAVAEKKASHKYKKKSRLR
jgi:transcriptional regulator with XRE-family HTH domain